MMRWRKFSAFAASFGLARCGLSWFMLALLASPLHAQVTQPASPVLQRLASGADGERLRLSRPVVSTDGSKLAFSLVPAFGQLGPRAVVYDVTSGKKVHEVVPRGGERAVQVVALSPDGRRAAIVTHGKDLDADNTLDLVSLPSGEVLYRHSWPYGYETVTFTPDGQRLLHNQRAPRDEGLDHCHFAVVDVEKGRIVGGVRTDRWDRPNGVISPDGKHLLTQESNTHIIKVWDLAASRLISTLEMDAHDSQRAVMYLPGTKTIQGVNVRGVVQTWDADTGKRLSKVEPNELLPTHYGMGFSADGKMLLIGAHGGIEFRDAKTGKPLGLWRHGPEEQSIAYIDAVREDTVVVNVSGDPELGDLAVLRLPSVKELQPPAGADNAREAIRKNVTGTTSAPVLIPPYRDADLREPSWWIDRAEAEWDAVGDEALRRRLVPHLAVARAAAGDDAGMERAMKPAREMYSNDAGWPMDEVRTEAAKHRARRLVRAGKMAEAMDVAEAAAGTHPQRNTALAEVVVEQALAGDVDGAMATGASFDPKLAARVHERAVRMLAGAGKFADAERLALRITDEHWRSVAFDRVAEAKARGGDVDGALAALGRADEDRRGAATRKVVRALAARRSDGGAQRVIGTLPLAEQNDGWHWLAQAQLDRGDIDAAVATATRVTGNPAYDLRTSIAVAQARAGRTADAIAAATAARAPSELIHATFKELIRSGRLDDAAQLLGRLLRTDASGDPRHARPLMLARALAEAGRIADAERWLSTVPADVARGAGGQDDAREAAAWAIAAAKRRTGDAAGYAAARQPLLDAVGTAPGGPSRAVAQDRLLRFQIATDDFASAEALLPSLDPQLYRGVGLRVYVELDGKTEDGEPVTRPPHLARRRALVRILSLAMDRPATSIAIAALARAHALEGKLGEWLDWSRSLPVTAARVTAYQSMAHALLPPEPEEPRD